ncbi:MAG: oxidoreductase C-terminal domain-containing protein, partial [Pseudomonadota bacterium]
WFWSDQHDVSLQIAGLPQFATQTVVRELGEDGLVEFGLDVDGRLVSASGVAAGNKIAREIRAAELMIGGRLRPEPAKLGDANVSLKSLLRR